MAAPNLDRLDSLVSSLVALRVKEDARMEEIARYVLPDRAGFTGSKPDGENAEIFDSTPAEANAILAATLHGLLTNPDSDWFALDLIDAGGNGVEADEEAAKALDDISEKMLAVFRSPACGFGSEVHTFYFDLPPLGWAVFYSEEDDDTDIAFSAVPPHQCYIAENSRGRVDTLARLYSIPLSSVAEAFPKAEAEVLRDIEDKAKKQPFDMLDIAHIVLPAGRVPELALTKGKYASIHYVRNGKKLLRASMYNEFPYHVPRWTKRAGEVYGVGPGHQALPDIRVLNKVAEAQLEGAEKQSDPPILAPNDAALGQINTYSGGITYYDPMSGKDIRPLPLAVDLTTMQAILEEKREAVRRAFLNDRILLVGGPQMTATEYLGREEKLMLILGPILGRMDMEFLGPLVERVFKILVRRGVISTKKLAGRDYRVRYASPIARAQKQRDASAFMQAIQFCATMLQARPESLDNFDADAIVRDSREIFGYPQEYLRDFAEVVKGREERAKAAQAAQAAELVGAALGKETGPSGSPGPFGAGMPTPGTGV